MPFLRLYLNDHLQGQWELTKDQISIGRAHDNDIILNHPNVSKHHARLDKTGNTYLFIDQASANGSFINNNRITSHALVFRDEVQIHPYRLLFMATAKLPGESGGLDTQQHAAQQQDMTTFLFRPTNFPPSLSTQEQPQVASLTIMDTGERKILDQVHFHLGRAADNHLHCGGWFAPSRAATIERRGDRHYLLPIKRARVFINHCIIREATRLEDGDQLEIEHLRLQYSLRTL